MVTILKKVKYNNNDTINNNNNKNSNISIININNRKYKQSLLLRCGVREICRVLSLVSPAFLASAASSLNLQNTVQLFAPSGTIRLLRKNYRNF